MRCLPASLLFIACATSPTRDDFRAVEQTVRSREALPDALVFDDTDTDATVAALLEAPLTVDAAVRISLLHNREARAVLADVGIARGDLLQAGLIPNPTAEFEVRSPGGDQPLQMDIGLDLNLSATLLAPLRSHAASAVLDAERLRAAGLLLDLAYRTRLAFFDVQAAQARLALRQRALDSFAASADTAAHLADLGNVPRLDATTHLAALEAARVDLSLAETDLVNAREQLHRLLGLGETRLGWSIDAPLTTPPPPEPVTEATAVATNLELAELDARTEAASRSVTLAKTEGALPALSAGFHGERDGTFWELGAHVAVGLPFFDRAQGRQLSTQSQLDGLRRRREATVVKVGSLLRRTRARAIATVTRARLSAEHVLPAREEVLRQSLRQYNAMTLDVFQLLAAQRAVTEAALTQVDLDLEAAHAQAALALVRAGRTTPLDGDAR